MRDSPPGPWGGRWHTDGHMQLRLMLDGQGCRGRSLEGRVGKEQRVLRNRKKCLSIDGSC